MTHNASHNASHAPRVPHRDEHADSADRLPPLDPATWTEAQRACAQEIIQGPRGSLIEPFVPLLRSPELCTHVQRTGEYLRYRSAIGLRLSELAILVTACHWRQQVEWSIHAPIAMREGIAPEVVQALAEGRRPDYQRADEALVHDFTQQSLQERRVSDATWASVRSWACVSAATWVSVRSWATASRPTVALSSLMSALVGASPNSSNIGPRVCASDFAASSPSVVLSSS